MTSHPTPPSRQTDRQTDRYLPIGSQASNLHSTDWTLPINQSYPRYRNPRKLALLALAALDELSERVCFGVFATVLVPGIEDVG